MVCLAKLFSHQAVLFLFYICPVSVLSTTCQSNILPELGEQEERKERERLEQNIKLLSRLGVKV